MSSRNAKEERTNEKVTKSGGESRFHFSCAQNVPVAPTPVCTSSTMRKMPCSLVSVLNALKNAGDAWLSPPSAQGSVSSR